MKRRSARLGQRKSDADADGESGPGCLSQELPSHKGNGTTSLRRLRPDVVPSIGVHLPGEGGEFDVDDYEALRQRYLIPRVRENAELGGGMTLRRQTVPAIIDQDRPAYRQLKRRVAYLTRSNDHAEIYRLLRQLRDWEINAGMMPTSMCEDINSVGDNEVVEMIDLSQHEEEDPIDVDQYIVDVLLVKVKEDPETIETAQNSKAAPTPDAVLSLAASELQVGTAPNADGTEEPRDFCRETAMSCVGAEHNATSDRPSSPDIINEVVDVDAEGISDNGHKRNPVTKWTRGEDDDLRSAASASAFAAGKLDWSVIGSAFPGRTGLQCFQRYQRLDPGWDSSNEGREGILSVVTRAQAQRQTFTLQSDSISADTGVRQSKEEAKAPGVAESIVTPKSEDAIIPHTENASGLASASSRPTRYPRRLKGNYVHLSGASFSSLDPWNEEVKIADCNSDASQLSSVKNDSVSSEWAPSTDESASVTSEAHISATCDIDCQERGQHLVPRSDGGIGSGAKLQVQPARADILTDATKAAIGRRHKRWTDEEDSLLHEAVKENGATNWASIAVRIPGRDSSRCRERWYNQLDPKTNRGEWTSSEDGLILEMQREMGNKWSDISTKLGTNRTGDLVKLRASRLLKKAQRLVKLEGRDESIATSRQSNRKRKNSCKHRKTHSKRKKGAVNDVSPVTSPRAPVSVGRRSELMTTRASCYVMPNSVFHHECLGSWKCRHGRSRTRREICRRCVGMSDCRLLSGKTARDTDGTDLANPPSFLPRQRSCNIHNTHQLPGDFFKRSNACGSVMPFDASFNYRGQLPYADADCRARLQLYYAIIPSARMWHSNNRRGEDDTGLLNAWREQARRRRKGEWKPTGGWKPPRWLCRQGATPPPPPPSQLASSNNETSRSVKVAQTGSGVSSTSDVGPTTSKSSPCGKALALRIADLLDANLLPTISRDSGESTGRIITSLDQVKYPMYQTPTQELLAKAHSALHMLLPEGDCDCIDSVKIARRYYNFWRPEPGKTRVILLAESHAFTSKNRALSSQLSQNLLPNYKGPREFISLVYCLAYGENEAVEASKMKDEVEQQALHSSNKGTPQFWQLLACLSSRGTKATPQNTCNTMKFPFSADVMKGGGLDFEDRLLAKVAILEDLRERGIWLLDASVIGWYITQKAHYRRSRVTNEVHRMAKARPPKNLKAPSLVLSWEMFTKHVVRAAAEEGSLRLLIPIGKEVEASLTRQRLEEALAPAGPSACVTESFPAPNAWIPGGYGPFFSKLERVVGEVAPPLPAPKTDLVQSRSNV